MTATAGLITTWTGCYREGWQAGDITEASFAHPAKVAKSLAFRLIRHLITQGYVQAGQTVVDPFCGIGGFALPALSSGLRFVGVELERKFQDIACGLDCPGITLAFFRRWYGRPQHQYRHFHVCPPCSALLDPVYWRTHARPRVVTRGPHRYLGNLDLWWRRYGFTGGTVVQGDSRQLRQVLAGTQAGCVVGSPPFSQSDGRKGGSDLYIERRRQTGRDPDSPSSLSHGTPDPYGQTEGQLGALPPGTPPACVVSSPPYAESAISALDATAASGGQGNAYRRTGKSPRARKAMVNEQYNAAALVSSPPYSGAGQVLGTHNGIDYSKVQGSGKAATPARVASGESYGDTPGQLGNMPTAIVGSPPYAESLRTEHSGIDWTKQAARNPGHASGRHTPGKGAMPANYGRSAGQLGAMPAGAVVSSPPYAEGCRQNGHDYHPERMVGTRTGYLQHDAGGYGVTPGNLGTEATTFWSAASAIMAEVSALLPVGGVACWVVKDYVSKGKRVPFCDQWRQLCERHGFRLVEEIYASLVEDHGTQEGLFGDAQAVTTERKSFFRRLAERKGSPRIDHETVLILVRDAC